MLEKFIIGLHLAGALGVVVLVLLQQGKGAEAGASFGAGASNTVFGGQGSSTFLSRLTAILAACFFLTSLGLGYFAKVEAHQQSDIGLPAQTLQVPTPKSAGDTPVLQGQQPANNSGAGDVPAAPAPVQK